MKGCRKHLMTMLNYIWITFASTSNLQLGGLNIATAGWHAGNVCTELLQWNFIGWVWSEGGDSMCFILKFTGLSVTKHHSIWWTKPHRHWGPSICPASGLRARWSFWQCCLVRWWWVMMALYKDAKIHCETYHKQIVALFRKYTKTVPTLSRHVDLSPRFRHEVWCGSLGSSMGRVCLSYCNRNLQADGTSSELPWKQETNSK